MSFFQYTNNEKLYATFSKNWLVLRLRQANFLKMNAYSMLNKSFHEAKVLETE